MQFYPISAMMEKIAFFKRKMELQMPLLRHKSLVKAFHLKLSFYGFSGLFLHFYAKIFGESWSTKWVMRFAFLIPNPWEILMHLWWELIWHDSRWKGPLIFISFHSSHWNCEGNWRTPPENESESHNFPSLKIPIL